MPGNPREFQLIPVIVCLLVGRKHGLLFFWFIDLLTYSETIIQHLSRSSRKFLAAMAEKTWKRPSTGKGFYSKMSRYLKTNKALDVD